MLLLTTRLSHRTATNKHTVKAFYYSTLKGRNRQAAMKSDSLSLDTPNEEPILRSLQSQSSTRTPENFSESLQKPSSQTAAESVANLSSVLEDISLSKPKLKEEKQKNKLMKANERRSERISRNPNPRPKSSLSRKEMRDSKVSPSAESGGIPNPSPQYMSVAGATPKPLEVPQHLLVVIDLNGTILYRPSRMNPRKFIARPHALRFLQYCIETFHVVIWSSARPENVNNLIDSIIPPVLKERVIGIWGRDKFGLSGGDYNLRVQCYKRLTKIWNDQSIILSHPDFSTGARWDQTNTVLVDDSYEKGRSEPFNLIEIPEFVGDHNEPGGILPQVHDHLNYLCMHTNVSACLRNRPFKAMAAPENWKR